MKAVAIKEPGPPHVLKVVEVPDPEPGNNQVVIDQSFAAVNYGDIIRRKRGLFKLNNLGLFVPGFEGAGKIVSVESGVGGFKKGDRVSYLHEFGGGYGQKICVDEQYVFKVPDSVDDEIAAGLTCVGATAWHLLRTSAIEKNQWILIHGATGGVGLMLLQLAKIMGIKTIAIVGTNEKMDFLKQFDIDKILVRDSNEINNQILSVTDNKGVHAIFDCVGQAVLDMNLKVIRSGGTILYYGSTSGHSNFPGSEILMNSLNIEGFVIFKLLQDKQKWQEGMENLYTYITQKKLRVNIDQILPMEMAPQAHQLLEDRKVIGKILLDMR